MQDLRPTIEAAWENRNLLQESGTQKAIRAVVSALDSGELRVAEPTADGWQVTLIYWSAHGASVVLAKCRPLDIPATAQTSVSDGGRRTPE